MVDTIDTLQRLPPPGPGRRTPASSADTSQSAPVILTLSSYDVPAVATLQPRPHHDGGGLGRPPPAVPPRAAPPRPRPSDQRGPRQEEEDRSQVSRAGGDA